VETEELRLFEQSRGICSPTWLDATLSILTSPDGRYTDEVLAGELLDVTTAARGIVVARVGVAGQRPPPRTPARDLARRHEEA
jgi:hypothetical protein